MLLQTIACGTGTTTTIEVLRFSDRSVDLTMAARIAVVSAADLKMLEELYGGFFNRVPEAEDQRLESSA